ncbi:hypothetical protein [Nocardia lasii]|uniref:Sensor histidine kinase n=1 Tax=Nocardia lasii TaxID=1616107 RepID=A0ABW1JQV4_9NOCA
MNRHPWQQVLFPGARSAHWLRVAFRVSVCSFVATLVLLTLLVVS